MANRERGTVKWFDDEKGYGFIEQDVGEDLFVHYSDIEQEGYKTLEEGQAVEFDIEETEKGLAAKKVVVVEDGDESLEQEESEAEESFEPETEDLGTGDDFDTDTLEESMSQFGG